MAENGDEHSEQSIPLNRSTSELRRSNSSPPTASFNDSILVKVVFPSLDCTKIFRLNPLHINYDPLVKILTIARVDDEAKKYFRLFTSDGLVIMPGDSLVAHNFKEKDTLIFKHNNEGRKLQSSSAAVSRRFSMSPSSSASGISSSSSPSGYAQGFGTGQADRKLSSSGDMRAAIYFQASLPSTNPCHAINPANSHPNNNPIVRTINHTTSLANLQANSQANNDIASNVDYWGAVSTFIGNFIKRRPSVQELPKHVLEMLGAPLVPQSHVIVACIAYLREKEGIVVNESLCRGETKLLQAYTIEGIFRLSGLATEVRCVCESFKQANFDLDWVKNPHTVATALKQYCRLASIIPASVCTPWVRQMRASQEETELLASIGKGFSTLPAENRFMLTCLFSFMKLVLSNQETNKMAPHSLSVVWGPNYVDAFSEANIQATIMYLILTHLDELRLWD